MSEIHFYTAVRVLIGVLVILSGIIGLLIPIIPGIILLVIGFLLIFGSKEHWEKVKKWLKMK